MFLGDLIFACDNGQGLVILTNGRSQAILREITKAVATEYGWLEKEYLPIIRKVVQLPNETLKKYIGEYEFPVGRNPRIAKIQLKDGKLFLDNSELLAESNVQFFGVGESTLLFNMDALGNVIELTLDNKGFKMAAKKIK